MYSLEHIIAINKNAVRKAKRGHQRSTTDHSSYTGTIETGIILHSGAHRECRFLEKAAAKEFVRNWMDIPARNARLKNAKASIQAQRDALIEAYF